LPYWDTSALIQLYVAENDSAYFLKLVSETDEPIVSASIATTEVLCVLHRKEHLGGLKAGSARRLFRKFGADVRSGRILLISYGREVEEQAEKLLGLTFAQPRTILIRSLDLIHVSSALVSRAECMVATDGRLRALAVRAGLRVLP